ncbi:hypothetical protein MIS45_06920 [Wielerella bovis]|uniref:hypothetical protein n=1 Tax=Wielerella bovis TaxID=2917790 RepID=UPI002019BE78|nr:hypothetical protein [Wielerella bovis]ULJ68535.1 hypothetical protein MIS45_06920 [Wielerella bovis]
MSSKHASSDVQTNEPQKQHPPQSANQRRNMRRIWIAAIVLSVVTVSVACFMNMQEQGTVEQTLIQTASETFSVIPITESEAAYRAERRNAEQVNGMIAPSDVENTASEAISASAASMVYSPADDLLADDDINQHAAQIHVENGVVKFTFASEKTEISDDVYDALKDVLSGAQEGKKVAIVGIPDATETESLRQPRIFAVRDVLLASGVPESQIEIRSIQKSSKDITHHVEVLLQ